MIKRAIAELLEPRAKCDRVGHNPRQYTAEIISYPPKHPRAVADTGPGELIRCKRCGALLNWRYVGESRSLQTLHMPAEKWKRLRLDGAVERND